MDSGWSQYGSTRHRFVPGNKYLNVTVAHLKTVTLSIQLQLSAPSRLCVPPPTHRGRVSASSPQTAEWTAGKSAGLLIRPPPLAHMRAEEGCLLF